MRPGLEQRRVGVDFPVWMVQKLDQIGAAYGKLMKWAGPKGLMKFPETKTVIISR